VVLWTNSKLGWLLGASHNNMVLITYRPLLIKLVVVRLVLSIVVSCGWGVHQIDICNVFLHGFLEESAYMQQPPSFQDPSLSHHVFKHLCQSMVSNSLLEHFSVCTFVSWVLPHLKLILHYLCFTLEVSPSICS
jgi:hypothetical protein